MLGTTDNNGLRMTIRLGNDRHGLRSVFIKEIILKNFFSIRSQKHNLKTVFITKKL